MQTDNNNNNNNNKKNKQTKIKETNKKLWSFGHLSNHRTFNDFLPLNLQPSNFTEVVVVIAQETTWRCAALFYQLNPMIWKAWCSPNKISAAMLWWHIHKCENIDVITFIRILARSWTDIPNLGHYEPVHHVTPLRSRSLGMSSSSSGTGAFRGPISCHRITLISAWIISNMPSERGMKLVIPSQTSTAEPLKFGEDERFKWDFIYIYIYIYNGVNYLSC